MISVRKKSTYDKPKGRTDLISYKIYMNECN